LRAVDVVLGDFGWVFDACADPGLGGLVVDHVDVFDDVVDEGFVRSRTLDELVAPVGLGRFTGYIDVVFLEAKVVERFENVEGGNVVAGVDERFGEMATNKASTACDEDVHMLAYKSD